MLDVTKISVRSFSIDHLDVFWEIAAVPAPLDSAAHHEIFNYDFYILRAGDGAMGPFEQIGGPFRDIYHFRDNQVTLLHKWRQYFYKIRVYDCTTGETKDFGPAEAQSPPSDLVAAEIIRTEDILFREFIGRKCWLFPIRTFGPQCSCFDTSLRRKTRANHAPCLGTGWLGGYMSPIECYIQMDPNPKSAQASALGEMQPSDSHARLIAFPPVSPRDVIVESENRRWRVMNVSLTERLRSVVHQELSLHEIPIGDIEYALPINVDASTLEPAASRNFVNAQSLDSPSNYNLPSDISFPATGTSQSSAAAGPMNLLAAGIWIGTSPPENPKTYYQWTLDHEGYWGYIKLPS